MSVSVTMPRLGESVSEGTVTRWLKNEGDRVEADEPLLEVSTDKVDTEIPAPASGVLTSIKVGEDETVDVGAELATIDDGGAPAGDDQASQQAPAEEPAPAQQEAPQATSQQESPAPQQEPAQQAPEQQEPAQQAPEQQAPEAQQPPAQQAPPPQQEPAQQAPAQEAPPAQQAPPPQQAPPAQQQPAQSQQPAPQQQQPAQQPPQDRVPAPRQEEPDAPIQIAGSDDGQGAYVTPLVRKLAAEHGVDLGSIKGTGVGGRIRKQDVLDAAQPAAGTAAPAPAARTSAGATAQAPAPSSVPAEQPLRGRTEKMSRLRSVIASRMLESLQVSAQLTTVVEADVTRISRLRKQAKAAFEEREGVKLSFLPFFALATIEALKVHPKVNAVIDMDNGTITYHDAEHLGIAVDTERGLLVPVIHDAGDLNLGGLARKIADLADRTRAGKVTPDELGGGTFTLTNTGSRGALFDTPIINQPQVGVLGTGSVVKRPVVVDDPELGESITVRSMVYLALTYDHRLVDGADAARFLGTIKDRLEAGAFEAALGL
ncbi:MAG: 2-oxoglutarate dehydrogenase, E2 component, dihydrolipoamide succinyltransferase [Mycobacteriales bacterium]